MFLPGESQGRGSPGGLPSMGLHRIGHNWSDLAGLSSSGDQVLGEHTLPRWGGVSNHLLCPSCSVSWVRSWSAISGVLCVSCREIDDLWLRPSWQMSTIQDPRKTLLATGSLLTVWRRMPSLEPRLTLPSGSGCHLLASLPLVGGGAGPQLAGSPLVFT